MAQILINVGNNADDGTGDTIRISGIKINEMFDELYLRPSMLSDITMQGNEISTGSSNADIDLVPSGTGNIVFPQIIFEDNNIKTTPSSSVLTNPTNKSPRCKWVAINKTQHDEACAKCSIVFFLKIVKNVL